MLTFALTGCSSTSPVPNVVVKSTQIAIQFPQRKDIQSLVMEDNTPAAEYWYPKNQSVIIHKILEWVKTAQSVTVGFPKTKSNYGFVDNIQPATLVIHTKQKVNLDITPASYLYSTLTKGVSQNYVDDVVLYRYGGKETYLLSPPLYQWLKNDQWKTEFIMH